MAVGQLIRLPIRNLWKADSGFRADTDDFHAAANSKFFDFSSHTRVDHNRASILCSTCNTSHSLSSSLRHSTGEEKHGCRLHELESVSDLTDTEIIVSRVCDSDEFCGQTHGNLHVMQSPELA